MIVVEKKPVPIYEAECCECKSKIQHKKSEVFYTFITCPVCGVSVSAICLCPVRYEGEGET